MMLWLLIALAYAEDEQETKVVYKQQTEIDFEGLEIEGQMFKPHGAVIQERKGAAFNPLIQLRTNFQVEMSQSVADIK
mgnify:CR=1 FL=1